MRRKKSLSQMLRKQNDKLTHKKIERDKQLAEHTLLPTGVDSVAWLSARVKDGEPFEPLLQACQEHNVTDEELRQILAAKNRNFLPARLEQVVARVDVLEKPQPETSSKSNVAATAT